MQSGRSDKKKQDLGASFFSFTKFFKSFKVKLKIVFKEANYGGR